MIVFIAVQNRAGKVAAAIWPENVKMRCFVTMKQRIRDKSGWNGL